MNEVGDIIEGVSQQGNILPVERRDECTVQSLHNLVSDSIPFMLVFSYFAHFTFLMFPVVNHIL